MPASSAFFTGSSRRSPQSIPPLPSLPFSPHQNPGTAPPLTGPNLGLVETNDKWRRRAPAAAGDEMRLCRDALLLPAVGGGGRGGGTCLPFRGRDCVCVFFFAGEFFFSCISFRFSFLERRVSRGFIPDCPERNYLGHTRGRGSETRSRVRQAPVKETPRRPEPDLAWSRRADLQEPFGLEQYY